MIGVTSSDCIFSDDCAVDELRERVCPKFREEGVLSNAVVLSTLELERE